MKRFPWLTLFFSALAIAVHFVPALTLGWQFDRAAIAHGQVWRFFTAHFTHFGSDHLRWDVIAFVVLGALVERASRLAFGATCTLSAALITLGVWIAQPQFITYRGLSGIDSALFGFVAVRMICEGRRERHRFSVVVGALAITGFAAKCALELKTGAPVFVDSAAFTPVPLAHLLGLIVGAAIARSNAVHALSSAARVRSGFGAASC